VSVFPIEGLMRWVRAAASLAIGRTVSEGAFWSPAMARSLRDWSQNEGFDVVLLSSSALIPYARQSALRAIPTVVDLVDVDSQKWLDYAASAVPPKRWLYRAEGCRLRRIERGLPDWARGVTLVSEAELDIYRQIRPTGRAVAVTNGVDLEAFQPMPQVDEEPARCVFVGALDYRPNVEGLNWFCRDVWPLVRARRPDAELTVVGRRPVPEVLRLGQLDGVRIIGPVADVRPDLARGTLAIVPLLIARGVQNKVLEAMAMGKAVVASPQARDGLFAEPGVHLRIATTPEEWVRVIGELLDDPDARCQLGEAARRYVVERHNWDRCLAPLGVILGLDPRSEGDQGPGQYEPASAELPTTRRPCRSLNR
jgi:sugar transferase (PEP-CTERM/EpsH1 system associated)